MHFGRLKAVPGENSHNEVVKDHKGNENNIIIFSDRQHSKLRQKHQRQNKQQYSKWAGKIPEFPRHNMGELLYYMDPTLGEGSYDTAIVHIGINDIINNDSSTKVENLVLNLEKIVIKLKKYGIKNLVFLAQFS